MDVSTLPGLTIGTLQKKIPKALSGPVILFILGVCLLACYLPMLLMTGQTIILSDDMAYGFFAPLIAGYLIWKRRQTLLAPTTDPNAWSLLLISFAGCLATAATLANSSTFSRMGFLISLTGCLLLLGGWPVVRQCLFPLVLLLFTFPVPDVLYGELTQPLQSLATRIAEFFLESLGYSVIREGNILQLSHMQLSVVEACSGLRSLITLLFFCLVYSYFFEKRLWLRIVAVLLSIPSAIAVNALRITTTGVLGKYNLAWTDGLYHEIVGWASFILGFLLILAAHKLTRFPFSQFFDKRRRLTVP